MKTLNDLKIYIEKNFSGEPDEECKKCIQRICRIEHWIYTEDSELNCYYESCVYAVDGKQQLAYYDETGWTVEDYEKLEIHKDNFVVEIREDFSLYYIDINTGLGEGEYPKAYWDFMDALDDQMYGDF